MHERDDLSLYYYLTPPPVIRNSLPRIPTHGWLYNLSYMSTHPAIGMVTWRDGIQTGMGHDAAVILSPACLSQHEHEHHCICLYRIVCILSYAGIVWRDLHLPSAFRKEKTDRENFDWRLFLSVNHGFILPAPAFLRAHFGLSYFSCLDPQFPSYSPSLV